MALPDPGSVMRHRAVVGDRKVRLPHQTGEDQYRRPERSSQASPHRSNATRAEPRNQRFNVADHFLSLWQFWLEQNRDALRLEFWQ